MAVSCRAASAAPSTRPFTSLSGKGNGLGTSNREPEEYSRKAMGVFLLGYSYSYYIPTFLLGFSAWGAH